MPDICGIHRDLVNFMLKKQEPRLGYSVNVSKK